MGDPIAPDSFQPYAPQEPGAVLRGRFKTMTMQHTWGWWVCAIAVILVIWYFWKKR